MNERLQKVIAHAGIGSRRACEDLILAGRVIVNGEVIRRLGTTVDPSLAEIKVDGQPIRVRKNVYYLLNKPRGILSTSSDELLRPTAVDLLQRVGRRVFAVGRLDKNSEGLLLLTNDGEFSQRVAHPRFQVPKTYIVRVRGRFGKPAEEAMTRGVWIANGKCDGIEVQRVSLGRHESTVTLILRDGKNRELRRVFAKLGFVVIALLRIGIGPVMLGDLKSGSYRPLSEDEVLGLLAGGGADGESTPPEPARPARRKRKAGWARPQRKRRGAKAPTDHTAKSPNEKTLKAPIKKKKAPGRDR